MSNLPGSPLVNSLHRRRESSKPTSLKSTASSYDRDGLEIVTVGGADGDLEGAVPLELVSTPIRSVKDEVTRLKRSIAFAAPIGLLLEPPVSSARPDVI